MFLHTAVAVTSALWSTPQISCLDRTLRGLYERSFWLTVKNERLRQWRRNALHCRNYSILVRTTQKRNHTDWDWTSWKQRGEILALLGQLGKSTGKPHPSQIFIKGFFDSLTAKKPKQLIWNSEGDNIRGHGDTQCLTNHICLSQSRVMRQQSQASCFSRS